MYARCICTSCFCERSDGLLTGNAHTHTHTHTHEDVIIMLMKYMPVTLLLYCMRVYINVHARRGPVDHKGKLHFTKGRQK